MANVHLKVVELFFNNKNLPFYRWSANSGAEILDEMFRSENNISRRTLGLVDFEFISSEMGSDNFCRNVIKVPRLPRDNHDHRGYIRLIMK